jgi:hypothetical protein
MRWLFNKTLSTVYVIWYRVNWLIVASWKVYIANLILITSFFQVEGEICRRKLLCELAENAEEFFPVSDIFFKQLE